VSSEWPRSGFPRELASGGENGVLQQLSLEDLLAEEPPNAPEPPRLLTPAEVAERCGLSYAPSPEQARVVAAPVDRPLVVVAGAGSGKTETMAARVSWLVANRLVAPAEILGLTFTRKAAGELAERVRLRLGALARHPGTDRELRERLDLEAPTVSTYHGYAASLVAEHGLRIGIEPGAGVLGPAMCWGQAAAAVMSWPGDLSDVPLSPLTTVEDVLALAGELGEHDVSPAQLEAWTARLAARVAAYPDAPKGPTGVRAPVREVLARQRARVALLPLVEAFTARKRALGAIDYADQVAHAARIAVAAPEVGRRERVRWKVVLLDEYQDTSVGQLRMLAALFGGSSGHPVLAVGDPRQSIYGWRGASAGTIERFPRTFPGRPGRGAQRLTLATSWRNDRAVLAVANAVAAMLPEPDEPLPDLAPAPTAGPGEVTVALHTTVAEETEALADRLAACWRGEDPAVQALGRRPTVAVLTRARKQFAGIAAALRERGVPVEVVGLGGLLAVPEVTDVVATLTVLVDATAGDALGRLLTGARWRIGPRDLAALEARGRALVHARLPAPAQAGVQTGDGAAADGAAGGAGAVDEGPRERGSIVEALDDLGDARQYSAAGYRRLRRLSAELHTLRGRLGDPVPDLVDEVARTLGLETELASTPGTSPALARTHLDALHAVAAEFAELAELPSLAAFLGYLRDADERERGLEPGEVAVNPEAVQLLTGHSAKGLEWDVVAVPGLTRDQFPARADAADSWIRDPGALPAALRLTDREELPDLVLPVPGSGDQAAVKDALDDYVERWKEFGTAEEVRLGYVTVTRARRLLLCSGSWWRDGKTCYGPSSLLLTVEQACRDGAGTVAHWAPAPADGATNPALEEWPVGLWPADPLSAGRRRALTAAAELVRGSAPHPLDPDLPLGDGDPLLAEWVREADLLLRERARHAGPTVDVPLPSHLSVSALVTLRRDPAELARRLRRPMPAAPAPQARRGTAFHAWLEERFGAARLLDLDELPGSGDELAAPDGALAELQQAFLASAWADRQPVEVEVPFETPLGPLTLRGRIDAVYADGQGGFEVVDWKTGPPPSGAELSAAGVQLAAYRLGWSRLTGVPVERVSAGFHHVAAGVTLRPVDLLDEAGLLALVTGTER
jgi:DNA helicase II / ATP-dependent DNA helicase PcrA